MVTTTETRSGDKLRARRRQRMADEIELAALRLFAERGPDSVTVDDIAAAADISRRTFFRYFASKEDVLHGNPERQRDIVVETAESTPATTTPQALVRRILLALTTDLDDRREALLLRKEIAVKAPNAMAQGHNRYGALVTTVIELLTEHMGVDPDSDLRPHVFVHAGLGAMQAATRTWFIGGRSASLHDLTAEALDLIGLNDETSTPHEVPDLPA